MDLEALKMELSCLPLRTADLPGVGGELKMCPEDFVVQEILPYEPCGAGEHVFVKLRRAGETSSDVARTLAACLGVRRREISFAGMKDKQAVATQTFSFHQPMKVGNAEIAAKLADLPYEVIEFKRHQHKLRTGHTRGNRFVIRLRGADNLAAAQAIALALQDRWLPNLYGEQRFGYACRGLERGVAVVERGRASRKFSFNVSVVQAALFNCWLKRRLEGGDGDRLIPGDVAKKTDSGGLFTVEDIVLAQARFERREVVYSGPIYGHKMMTAAGPAAARENEILAKHDLTLSDFKPLHAAGTRRPGLIAVEDLEIEAEPKALCFSFRLPSGSYATMVMREFMEPV